MGAYDVYSSNTFSKNTRGVDLFSCVNARIRSNSFSANSTGISATRLVSMGIESNHIAGGTIGIDFESHNQDAVITRNTITNGRVGVRVVDGGVPLDPRHRQHDLEQRDAKQRRRWSRDHHRRDPVPAVNNNLVIANLFDGNGFHPAGTTNSPLGTAIINDGAYANVLAGNDAFTFSDNIATGNAGHGIQALTGIDDGGGNTASGNGGADQCLGVAC